jgi:hypothetical protein
MKITSAFFKLKSFFFIIYVNNALLLCVAVSNTTTSVCSFGTYVIAVRFEWGMLLPKLGIKCNVCAIN